MAGLVREQPHVVLVQMRLSRVCTPRHAGRPVRDHPPLRHIEAGGSLFCLISPRGIGRRARGWRTAGARFL